MSAGEAMRARMLDAEEQIMALPRALEALEKLANLAGHREGLTPDECLGLEHLLYRLRRDASDIRASYDPETRRAS